MKKKIALKIDVSKIDKQRLYKGEKGTYLDAIYHYDSEEDQYGQHGMITQSVSEEERKKDVKGAILGNGKIVWSEKNGTPPKNEKPNDVSDMGDMDDDLPF